MRAVRFLTLAVLLVVGVAGSAKAQGDYNNTPGTYNDVKVGVVPALLPAGSLPSDINALGPDLYIGTLTISQSGGLYTVQYQGSREDGAKLNATATFDSDWAGIKLGTMVVGSSLESNVIMGIDVANLLSAHVNGVGTVDGKNQRLLAKIGAGGSVDNVKVLKAPGNLR